MEVNIARQLAFSFLAATGVFAMHFTGMSAATWYSTAPPTDEPGYPPALSLLIVAFVIFTCLISTYVAHQAWRCSAANQWLQNYGITCSHFEPE